VAQVWLGRSRPSSRHETDHSPQRQMAGRIPAPSPLDFIDAGNLLMVYIGHIEFISKVTRKTNVK
jgi:hypothetical protein